METGMVGCRLFIVWWYLSYRKRNKAEQKKAGKEITQHSSFHAVTIFQMSRNIHKYLFYKRKRKIMTTLLFQRSLAEHDKLEFRSFFVNPQLLSRKVSHVIFLFPLDPTPPPPSGNFYSGVSLRHSPWHGLCSFQDTKKTIISWLSGKYGSKVQSLKQSLLPVAVLTVISEQSQFHLQADRLRMSLTFFVFLFWFCCCCCCWRSPQMSPLPPFSIAVSVSLSLHCRNFS